ncbi:Predicted small secreted protein [Limimonas halophila]|uniref:Predicted small secreted protein n=1 Tax=Limimonas halophila TaxID=1082479 RepID=A0A1G7LIU6_9PROT|nr:entericidin A/B family lipoprotein [Limimonas halophila]SDF49306.1 Predicted small secreted protein [Limimonas halophila]
MRSKPLIVLTIVAAPAGAVSACNTSEGLGQDVENTGEALEEEAED